MKQKPEHTKPDPQKEEPWQVTRSGSEFLFGSSSIKTGRFKQNQSMPSQLNNSAASRAVR